MGFLKELRDAVVCFSSEISNNPHKTEYTPDEVLTIYNNSKFKNPLTSTISCWEKANKPNRVRLNN